MKIEEHAYRKKGIEISVIVPIGLGSVYCKNLNGYAMRSVVLKIIVDFFSF